MMKRGIPPQAVRQKMQAAQAAGEPITDQDVDAVCEGGAGGGGGAAAPAPKPGGSGSGQPPPGPRPVLGFLAGIQARKAE
jgi:hypothetical protein